MKHFWISVKSIALHVLTNVEWKFSLRRVVFPNFLIWMKKVELLHICLYPLERLPKLLHFQGLWSLGKSKFLIILISWIPIALHVGHVVTLLIKKTTKIHPFQHLHLLHPYLFFNLVHSTFSPTSIPSQSCTSGPFLSQIHQMWYRLDTLLNQTSNDSLDAIHDI